MIRFVLLICFFILVNFGNAQIITDRPDQTESSSTIEKGNLQIESGILLVFNESDLSSTQQLLAPTTLFRYGIINGLEIRVFNQFESLKDQNSYQKINGISDLELGTKIQLLKKENINTEIAFLSHVVIPTGTASLSNDKLATINKLSISHQLSENMGLGYNIGYDYFGDGNGDFIYSFSLGISVTNRFSFYLEPYGSIVDFDEHKSNFDAGIAYLLNDNCQLDFSFGTGINNTMNYLSVGYSINISKDNN